jgi:phosphoribulokinase
LGIVGDPASGKTTISQGIANILGSDTVVIICTDDYYNYERSERVNKGLSALSPESNYIYILVQHLQLLKEGKPVLKPTYNHIHGNLDKPVYVEPRKFIIVEGLLSYLTCPMRNVYDVKVYVERPKISALNGKLGKIVQGVIIAKRKSSNF